MKCNILKAVFAYKCSVYAIILLDMHMNLD